MRPWGLLAALAVMIRVVTVSPCPPKPVSEMVKQPDGSYQRGAVIVAMTTEWCEIRTENYEEWTDYPEKGGVFIRPLGPVPAEGNTNTHWRTR